MSDVEGRELDFRNPTSYEEVIFGVEDLDVFEIMDVKQRSAAVQKLYFPRLDRWLATCCVYPRNTTAAKGPIPGASRDPMG